MFLRKMPFYPTQAFFGWFLGVVCGISLSFVFDTAIFSNSVGISAFFLVVFFVGFSALGTYFLQSYAVSTDWKYERYFFGAFTPERKKRGRIVFCVFAIGGIVFGSTTDTSNMVAGMLGETLWT